MDISASQPVIQPKLRSVRPLQLAWIIIGAFVLWGLVGVYAFEGILSNFYFLIFWLVTMLVEGVLLLVLLIKNSIEFFRVRKISDVALKKKATIRFVFSLVGFCMFPFLVAFLGLMLLSLAPGLKY